MASRISPPRNLESRDRDPEETENVVSKDGKKSKHEKSRDARPGEHLLSALVRVTNRHGNEDGNIAKGIDNREDKAKGG